MQRPLPSNIEAECGVLGSIIIDPEAIVHVINFLHAKDFYRDAHRVIYGIILTLYHQHAPADFITLCDELERRNKLDEVGGSSYITSLINGVPTSGNIEYYGRIVKRTSVLRRLIEASGHIAASAYEAEEDADVALEQAEQLIFAIRQGYTLGQAKSPLIRDGLSAFLERLDRLHQRCGALV